MTRKRNKEGKKKGWGGGGEKRKKVIEYGPIRMCLYYRVLDA